MDHKEVTNKTQSEKIKRMQLMARVHIIIGDEVKAHQMLQYTRKLKNEKRLKQLQGKDYMMQNVERASIWPELS